jgi:CheY-like chemotaxis protein
VIRIVFVDDDVNLLEAMRLRMRPMRDTWSMEFVSRGEEALESLAKCSADVVASDMRMPRMDGWQLLTEVKELYPQTVRLVLSGHADPGGHHAPRGHGAPIHREASRERYARGRYRTNASLLPKGDCPDTIAQMRAFMRMLSSTSSRLSC